MIIHPIKPVFDKDSRILILGSFPYLTGNMQQSVLISCIQGN